MASHYTIAECALIKEMVNDGKSIYEISRCLKRGESGVRAYCIRHGLSVHKTASIKPDGDIVPIPYCDGYFLDKENKALYSTRTGVMKKLKPHIVGDRPYTSFIMPDGKRMAFSLSKIIYCTEHNIDPRIVKEHNLTVNEDGVVEDLFEVYSRRSHTRKKKLFMDECESADKQISYLKKQAEICNNVADALSRSDTTYIITLLESFRPQAERYLTRIGYKNKEWQKISIDAAIDSVAEGLIKNNRCFILSEFIIGAYARKQYAMLRKKRKGTVSIDKEYSSPWLESYGIETNVIGD